MKKIALPLFSCLLVLTLLLGTTSSAQALAPVVEPTNGVSGGEWESGGVAFTEIPQDLVVTPGPAWMQVLTNGIVLESPATICHKFRGYLFGWRGDIRKLEGDTWVKVPGTILNPEGIEGATPTLCASVSAGTYALWGYFDSTLAPKQDRCSFLVDNYYVDWDWDILGSSFVLYFYGAVNPAIAPNALITLKYNEWGYPPYIDSMHVDEYGDFEFEVVTNEFYPGFDATLFINGCNVYTFSIEPD